MYTLLAMPDTPSIVMVKEFPYRGQNEEWSNKYHFSGTTPANAAAWKALADALGAAEAGIFTTQTKIVRAYGYEAGNDIAVWSFDYRGPPDTTIPGTLTFGASSAAPGDAAATIRWYTGAVNSRGKKIYCRKYFHDVKEHSTTRDALDTSQQGNYATFAAKVIDGTLPGSFRYCGPQGAVLSSPSVSPWITTRTLKRRGKRPPTT